MIDIHSHIIYGIDDGCKTLDESIQTILNLKKVGFDRLILTPHYINGSNYNKDNKEKKERLNVLKEENGILIEPGDVEKLSEALMRYCMDQETVEKIGKNNIALIHTKYSMDAMHQKLAQYYIDVMQEKRV